jgi:hypothetical protein
MSLPVGNKEGSGRLFFPGLGNSCPVPDLRGSRLRSRLPKDPFGRTIRRRFAQVKPIKVGARIPMRTFTTEIPRFEIGKSHQELAQFIEGHVNRVANGRIRDLHVVYSDEQIILQGRSRTYHAKQLAHQAVLDLTDGYPLLANQIVVA